MDWDEQTIAQIREMWTEGLSTAEIGRRMGITKNAVVGKAHRLNLPPRPSPIRRVPSHGQLDRPVSPKRNAAPPLSAVDAVAPSSPPALPPVPPRTPVVLRTVPVQRPPAGRVSACCWPLGEPGTPSFRFCGDPAMQAKPYCAQHAALAYVKVRDRREDAA